MSRGTTLRPVSISNAAQRRATWLKRMHEWHWISAAVALLGLLLFSVTGITLNHAEALETSEQQYTAVRKDVPTALVESLSGLVRQEGEGQAEASEPLRTWAKQQFGVDLAGRVGDWSEREVYFPLERPGGDAWLKVDLRQAVANYSRTDAGWVAYFNDLHKGRNTGRAWAWFIDVLALACIVFAVTGLVILKMHARNRALTWPLVGLGVLVPFLVAVLFIH